MKCSGLIHHAVSIHCLSIVGVVILCRISLNYSYLLELGNAKKQVDNCSCSSGSPDVDQQIFWKAFLALKDQDGGLLIKNTTKEESDYM